MKKTLILIIFCFVFLILFLPSTAQELSKDIIDIVSDNKDNFFPISAIKEQYANKTTVVRSNIGPETATETSTNGTRNILLYANPDGKSEYSLFDKVNAGNLKNFYYSIDVLKNEIYPDNGGGCYIGYINEFTVGSSADDPVRTISLILSDGIYLETKDVNTEFSERIKLSGMKNGKLNLLIIRMTGETLFYADGNYIGSYHDGLNGPFQLRYGTKAFSNGEIADCSFDNLIIRKVTR